MSGTTNYGPLNKQHVVSEAKGRITDYKAKKGAVPLKFRVQEATMRVSKAITEGSFEIAKPRWFSWGEFFLMPVAIVGAVSLGVQKIAEAQFGKSIDLTKDKTKELEYIAHLSKARIDKNVHRGVIDKPTGKILKTLKEMTKEVLPKEREEQHLEKENEKLTYKLKELESGIGRKKRNLEVLQGNQKLLSSSGNSLKIEKMTKELKSLNDEKNKIEVRQRANTEKVDKLESEIKDIEAPYTKQLEKFAKTRERKIEEKNQRKQDKSLLHLEKHIGKKYKFKGEFRTELKAEIFFNDKYKAYVKRCDKSNTEAITKNEFIKKYYERKGIDYETEVL
jgi:chromosome segregation ATPase